jgi:hypothetical protein
MILYGFAAGLFDDPSFKGKFAQLILADRRMPKGFPSDLGGIARRKLVQLDAAAELSDLMTPPGNQQWHASFLPFIPVKFSVRNFSYRWN